MEDEEIVALEELLSSVEALVVRLQRIKQLTNENGDIQQIAQQTHQLLENWNKLN